MKIHFFANSSAESQAAKAELSALYGDHSLDTANAIVALGGDGTLLSALRATIGSKLPVYGMNRGSLGFLMNPYDSKNLIEKLMEAEKVTIHPLSMKTETMDCTEETAIAYNEVSLLRQVRQAAKIRISIDGIVRIDELICDGIIVATPAGSTAYNLSATSSSCR